MSTLTVSRHYTVADIPAQFRGYAVDVINAHGLRLIREFEGPPRTVARMCEGGAWELGPGVTFHFDGRPVRQGETCDPAYGEALFLFALRHFAEAVDAAVTVPINSNQRAALTAFFYNVGIANARSSTVLREVNALRFHDAAAAFGMWIFATKGGHKQALRGLLRREYATGCLFLSYDWTEACQSDAIALQRELAPMVNGRRKGTDRVIYKTPWSEVLRVAQAHPLPDTEDDFLFDPTTISYPSTGLPEEEVELEPLAVEMVAPSPSTARAGEAQLGKSSVSLNSEPEASAEGEASRQVRPPTQGLPESASNSAGSVQSPPPAEGGGAVVVPAAPPPLFKDGTKPPTPKTLDNIAKDAGLDRNGIQKAVVAVLVWIGYTMRTVGANGMKIFGLSGSTVSVLADQLNQPFVQIMVGTAFFVCICGVLWAMGLIAEKAGLKRKKKLERAEAAP